MYGQQIQSWYEPLNRREVEILVLISEGLSNREIAQRLHFSLDTVKWYNKKSFAKLGVNNRLKAVKIAEENGILNNQAISQENNTPEKTNNLPFQLTSFVGRSKELSEIKQLLRTSRLVVLTGPGGCGKSRLAMQVAAELSGNYRDGAWLVELASLNDPDLVTSTIIKVLKVNASSPLPLVDILKRFLAQRHLLLILDNFEHLSDATPLVGELLASAPRVTILATSRERLHVYGEQQYQVNPLSLPDLQRKQSNMELLDYEAVALFVQRAQAARPGFVFDDLQMQALAHICVRLDGLPLAIELAASQVGTYPPSVLAELLKDNLDVLPSGPRNLPERQRTLRATLEWSYQLLSKAEQTLFNRLSIFNGGGRLESVEQVCSTGIPGKFMDHLNALVEVNLLYAREEYDGQLRFTMLETVHEYASEKLAASGEADSMYKQHAEYFTRLAESAEKEMRSSLQTYWFARLAADQDNLRSILNWSLNGTDVEYGLRLAAAMRDYWYHNALGTEGSRWTELALARRGEADTKLRASVLRSAGQLATILIDTNRGTEWLLEAAELYQQSGDKRNSAWSLITLAGIFTDVPNDLLQGIKLCEEGLTVLRELDDKPGIAYALNILGEAARQNGDFEAARLYYEESLSIVKETGESQREAMLISNLSLVASHQGNYQLALQLARQSLALAGELKSDFRQSCFLADFAGPAAALGQPERAARLLGASYAQYEALGARHFPVDQLEFDRFEAAARNLMGDVSFQAAWLEGQSMTLQEAVAYALGELDVIDLKP